jgi:hypothetical protein
VEVGPVLDRPEEGPGAAHPRPLPVNVKRNVLISKNCL